MRAHLIRFGLLAVLLALSAPAAAAAQEAGPPSPDGMNEGVAVHGHWTITVLREGEVVERREFKNALTNGGQAHLALLLARTRSTGPWTVLVEADGSGSLCADNTFVLGDDTDCTISEASAELTASTTENATVILQGSETVQRDGNLQLVNTYQQWCAGDVAPTTCSPAGGGNQNQFTRADLEPLIPVQNGDQIEVTVELSFN
jgi:hypothetical protein